MRAVVRAFTLFLAVLMVSQSSRAAYDQTVTWSDMSDVDLRPILANHYSSETNLFYPVFSPSVFPLVLKDADKRIDNEFKIPAGMKNTVEFWLKIYTLYSTKEVVLFDERHPEIVYDVLDFRSLSKTARNQVVYEILMKRQLTKAVANVREGLKSLARNPGKKGRSEIERKIIAAVSRSKHKHSFKEMASFIRTQTGQRDNVIKGLIAAEIFFPKMEEIFETHGLPSDLTRLALVESSFNLKALSRVGAAGVWQFMRRSALEYMLIDDKNGIDERLSPLKSTVAAAKLLTRNKRILSTWALAVTSYNHGIRNLKKIPSSINTPTNISRVFDPCSKESKLGWASKNYFAEFLAVLHAEKYRDLFYGTPPLPKQKAIVFHKVDKAETPLTFAMQRSIGLQEFHFLNPDIRNLHQKLPKGFLLAIPGDTDNLAHLVKKTVKKTTALARPKNVDNST